MEDFERQLKSLSLRGPSAGLDARVRAALAGGNALAPAQESRAASASVARRPGHRSISTRWALAAALLMGLLGFLAGRFSEPGHQAARPLAAGEGSANPAVTVHVVYEGRAANPFDCTVAADDTLRDVTEIKINAQSGV